MECIKSIEISINKYCRWQVSISGRGSAQCVAMDADVSLATEICCCNCW